MCGLTFSILGCFETRTLEVGILDFDAVGREARTERFESCLLIIGFTPALHKRQQDIVLSLLFYLIPKRNFILVCFSFYHQPRSIHSQQMPRIHIVTNPASGASISSRILPEVLSALSKSSTSLELIQHETKSEGAGHNVAREILKSEQSKSIENEAREDENQDINLVVLGGDGTTHELLDGFFNPKHQTTGASQPGNGNGYPKVNFALVPIGTSNALYHSIYPPESQKNQESNTSQSDQEKGEEDDSWRFHSLNSMIESLNLSSNPKTSTSTTQIPLTLSLTKHSSPTNKISEGKETFTISHLLTSHSLHASILKDSEALRESIPSIERFKVAAQQNSIRWTSGNVRLFGSSKGGVQKYDRKLRKFIQVKDEINHQESKEEDNKENLDLRGPFIYLICLSIDRLEPSFIPAPFSSNHQGSDSNSTSSSSSNSKELTRPSDLLDVLMIRPLRDPSVRKNLTKLGLETHLNDKVDSRESQLWDTDDTLELRKKFAETRLGPITVGMYSGGKHVGLGYKEEPQEIDQSRELGFKDLDQEGAGAGVEVVEYYRCKGYEWNPVS